MISRLLTKDRERFSSGVVYAQITNGQPEWGWSSFVAGLGRVVTLISGECNTIEEAEVAALAFARDHKLTPVSTSRGPIS